MQTSSLPIQSSAGAGNANAAARNAPSPSSDAGQFGAMLSNEMEQRLAMAPVPAPMPAPAAPKPEAPKPQAAGKPAQPDDAPARASQSNEAAKSAATDESRSADEAGDESSDGEDADTAKADPAAQMLALMASLQHPIQDAGKAGKSAGAQAFDALGGGKGKRSDLQLAALQAAMKSSVKGGATLEPGAKTFAAPGIKNPALAAAGADLATDTRAAATSDAADLRAALAPGAVKAELKPQMMAADLALQQARTAATQLDAAPAAAAMAQAQAQPAMLEAAQATFAAGETLSARVGTSQWEHQVGQKIVYMVGSEEQTASLTLNPPDLGPMQVVLSVSNDQASVTFSSNQQEVRQALENALPRLREMMSESGIALGNATVNAGMPDGRQAQDQGAQSGGGFGRSPGQRDGNAGVAETATRPARTAILGDRGMVDTFA